MFVHHVLFTLKNKDSEADKQALIEGLQSLQGVETVKMLSIGTPAATDRPVINKDYSVSLLTLFDNAAGETIYQTHPVHLAFIDKCKHLWEKVVIFDADSEWV